MKILLVTQAVDRKDQALGFFHEWIAEFAAAAEQVTVICLREGEYALPENVRVLSLGKERAPSRLRYVLNFYRHAISRRREYDAVLVHMNPEYLILGGLLWKMFRKKTALWYVHRQSNFRLRCALALADRVFTVAPESFPIKTSKVRALGHGISLLFGEAFAAERPLHSPIRIASVGRLSPIKNQDVLIKAVAELGKRGVPTELHLVGAPVTPADQSYAEELKKLSAGLLVFFRGIIPNAELPAFYQEMDASVNLAPIGLFDKTVFESAAAGCLPLASNESFRSFFAPYEQLLLFREKDPTDLAGKLAGIPEAPLSEIRQALRGKTYEAASLSRLVGRIMEEFKRLCIS